jgi:hypothetical protein
MNLSLNLVVKDKKNTLLISCVMLTSLSLRTDPCFLQINFVLLKCAVRKSSNEQLSIYQQTSAPSFRLIFFTLKQTRQKPVVLSHESTQWTPRWNSLSATAPVVPLKRKIKDYKFGLANGSYVAQIFFKEVMSLGIHRIKSYRCFTSQKLQVLF